MTDSERKAFKDYFDRAAARALAKQFSAAYPQFDSKGFVREASKGLDELEFAGRVQHFSDTLRRFLPESLPKALAILTKSLPDAPVSVDSTTDGWLQWPLGQFIADHGGEHLDQSMEAMIELTQRFSSEFAVRPFLETNSTETFARLTAMTNHPSAHVRRWCSEGTRPRLPWGRKLHALVKDPSPIFPILDALKDDPELYVRRSVANNLNDIAKDHPKMVVRVCREWTRDRNVSDERRWLVKHALRSLIKNGDPGALAVMGVKPPKSVTSALRVAPKSVCLGDTVTLTTELANNHARAQTVLVDYVVHLVRKGGKTSKKVFKWKKLELAAGERVILTKAHSMRETTVRRLYPGEHTVELQLNGHRVGRGKFQLK